MCAMHYAHHCNVFEDETTLEGETRLYQFAVVTTIKSSVTDMVMDKYGSDECSASHLLHCAA